MAFVQSLAAPARTRAAPPLPVANGPPTRWAERVNKSLTGAKLHAVRTRVTRGRPLGDETLVQRIALQLNL
jgi:hypothetical protein